jgi:hypothetical protein
VEDQGKTTLKVWSSTIEDNIIMMKPHIPHNTREEKLQ